MINNLKIYTLTMNPAIDLFIKMEKLEPIVVNRTEMDDAQANGKAINISFILKQLGIDSTAMGFLAGFTGEYIKSELKVKEIETDFIDVEGTTRINVFLNADQEYRIVNRGPIIKESEEKKLIEKLKSMENNSYLFVSGSLPQGIDENIFVEISKICYEKDIKLIYDISSKKILECLKYKPYLLKPNEEELSEFFDKENLSDEEVLENAKKLIEMGAEKVLVTLGAKGIIYVDKENSFSVDAIKGEIVNTACAGDTALATFIGKLLSGLSIEDSLKYSSIAGSLTAFSPTLGDMKELDNYFEEIKTVKI